MRATAIDETTISLTAGKTTPAQRRVTWVILAAALVARLGVLLNAIRDHPHDWLYTRGIEMGLLANSLLHGMGYSSPFGGSTGPTAFIAPGYPTLVAGIFLLFGTYTYASAIAIMVGQIVVSLVTIWLMMWVAREIMDDGTAKLAGALWAISLPVIFIPTIFWDTSISACVLLGMIALALLCGRRPSLSLWIAMGFACGTVGLINPALLPSLLAILGWVAYRNWKTVRLPAVVGLLVLVMVYSVWPIRNAYRFHAFIPLRSTVGFELWMGNRPGATGYLDESIFPMYNKGELASYISMGELAYTHGKSLEAKEYIKANPAIFVKMTLRRFWRFWTGTGNLQGSPFYAMHAVTTSALGILGLWTLYRRRMFGVALLFTLPLLIFPLPYYITHAEFRYRLVIDPLLTILAACAVTRVVARSHVAGET
jgi:hypothetical protein